MDGSQGVTIGPYSVLAELGRGGMGAVYRAWDPAAEREVALKVVNQQASPVALARLLREGELAARLQHPGIVGVHAAGEDSRGRPYVAFELVEGCRDLRAAFLGRDLPERVGLVRDAAEALGYAHAQGLVHRDVKPENVLVDPLGQVKIADFGLALAQDMDRLTRSGAFVGTVTHMPPEQFSGREGEPDATSDVWSLGVLLYEALTGELPFDGEGFAQVVARVMSAEPKPPRLVADVPAELEAVCLRALSKDPAGRQSNGAAFAAELDALLARSASWSSSHAGRVLLRIRRRAAPLLAALLLLLSLAGLIWLARSGGSAVPGQDDPDGAPEIVPESGLQPPSAAEDAEALEELKGLELLASRWERSSAVGEWIQRHPKHPEASAARARLRETRLDGALWSWDAAAITAACFLDEDHVAVYVSGVGLQVFDLRQGRVTWSHTQTMTIVRPSLAVSPSRSQIAFTSANQVTIATPKSGQAHSVTLDGEVMALAWSPSGRTIAAGGRFAGAQLIDEASGRITGVLGAQEGIRNLAYSSDGALLAAGAGRAGDVRASVELWSLGDGRLRGQGFVREKVNSLVFGLQEEVLLVGDNAGRVVRFSTSDMQMLGTLAFERGKAGVASSLRDRAHQGNVNGLVLDRQRGHLLSAAGRAERSELRAWSTQDWTLQRTFLSSRDGYWALDLSQDGEHLLLVAGPNSHQLSRRAEVWHMDALRSR